MVCLELTSLTNVHDRIPHGASEKVVIDFELGVGLGWVLHQLQLASHDNMAEKIGEKRNSIFDLALGDRLLNV